LLDPVEEAPGEVPLAIEPWTEGEGALADRARRRICQSAALRRLGADGAGVVGLVGEQDAARKLWNENLFHIGLERHGVDRAVGYHGCDHAGGSQAGDEGGRLPVAMRHAEPQAFPAPATALAARHVGGSPGLVDEDEPLRVQVQLAVEPGLALFQDIGAVLLGRVRGLFFQVMA